MKLAVAAWIVGGRGRQAAAIVAIVKCVGRIPSAAGTATGAVGVADPPAYKPCEFPEVRPIRNTIGVVLQFAASGDVPNR